MTPSEQAKKAGLKSLAEVERMSGVQKRTLINWQKTRPQLFALLLLGCQASSAE
jgi:hypothetical protein